MKKNVLSLTLAFAMFIILVPTIPKASAASQPENAVRTVATGILMSERHFLAVRSDNTLWAWGNNSHGQLGDGTTTDRTSSNPVKVMDNVKFVAAEQGFSMAITTDGVLWSWGANTYGRLGDGTVTNRHSPVRVMDNVTYVALGRDYAFAIKSDGGLYSWGENIGGSLGNGGPYYGGTNQHSPVKIMDNVINVGTGINVVNWAVKSDNSLWVWGSMFDSTIETFANVRTSSTPTKIASSNVAAMEMIIMGRALFLLRPSGDLHGLGNNEDGELGNGTGINSDELVWITNDVASVASSGGLHDNVFIIRRDNSLWGWGGNYGLCSFKRDLSSDGIAYTPMKLMDGVLHIIDGRFLLKTDGTFWDYGSFGEPTLLMSDIAVPRQPTPLDSASSWARDGITDALSNGFVPTDIQGSYTNVITRAEFCRMAVNWLEYRLGKGIDAIVAENGDTAKTGHTFSDTNDPAILAAYRLGITSGTSAPMDGKPGTFNPNGQFSREQAATMIRNTCRAAGMDVSDVASAGFEDIGSASSWAADGINYVRNAGIMGGTSTTPLLFSPQSNYTREQSIITFNNIK